MDRDWIDLPGPASWWDNDQTFELNNWDTDTDVWNAKYTFYLVVRGFKQHVPKDFLRIAPSENFMGLLPEDILAYM